MAYTLASTLIDAMHSQRLEQYRYSRNCRHEMLWASAERILNDRTRVCADATRCSVLCVCEVLQMMAHTNPRHMGGTALYDSRQVKPDNRAEGTDRH